MTAGTCGIMKRAPAACQRFSETARFGSRFAMKHFAMTSLADQV